MKRTNSLNKEPTRLKLYEEERAQLRESLLAYMEKTPVVAQPQEEVIVVRSSKTAYVAALVAGIVIAGTGVSIVAERATPGSALYPIKVGINDRVRSMMASPTQATSQAQNDLLAPAVVTASSTESTGTTETGL